MPVSRSVDHRARLIRLELSGTLTTEAMLSSIDDAVQDISGASGYRVLSDHRRIETPATPEQIQAIVRHIADHGVFNGSRWAIIVGQPASFGMMAQLSRFAATIPLEVGVYQTPAQAEAWIAEKR